MSDIQSEMRATAKQLLESGEATVVIGWEKGTMPYNSTPVMIRSAADVDKLIWDEYCQQNLSTYLIDFIYTEDKVAIFAKGCDTRAYNRLKTWKQRGKISAEEWNRRVAHIQDVKSEFLAGGMSDAEYTAKLDQV